MLIFFYNFLQLQIYQMNQSLDLLRSTLLLLDDNHELTLCLLTYERLYFQLQNKQNKQIFSATINMNQKPQDYWGWFQNAEIAYQTIKTIKEDMVIIQSDNTVVLNIRFEDAPTTIRRKIKVHLKKQEKSIDFNNKSALEQRVLELERYMINLTKTIMKIQENHLKDLNTLKTEKDKEISLLREELSCLSISQSSSHTKKMKKHNKIRILGNKLINIDQNNPEIRWAMIGQLLSSEKTSYLVVKINKLNWLAFGICDQASIRSRSFTRLNGKGQHNSHLMDNNGWVYAQTNNLHNYKPLGFDIHEGDVVTVKLDPKAKCLSFCNENSLRTYSLYLQSLPQSQLLKQTFCLACSSTTEVIILERVEQTDQRL